MLLKVELPVDYPNTIPFMLLKNLAPKYLDNNMIDEYESEIRAKAHESVGNQMMFDICDALRERIAELNDNVVAQFKGILEAEEEKERESYAPTTFMDADNVTYTPVTKESFGIWCVGFLEKLKA